MVDPQRERGERRHGLSSSVPVLLLSASLVFVGLLALQAYRAERAREAGARSTLLGYAQVVAFQMESDAFQSLNRDIPAPFAALDRAPRGARGVEVLLESPAEAQRCGAALAGGRWSFRAPLSDGGWMGAAVDAEWHGDVPSAQLQRAVLQAAAGSLKGLKDEGGSYGVALVGEGASPAVVALAVRWRPSPENTSLYGFRTCLEGDAGPLFRQAMLGRAVLPPALTGGARGDSLFAARVVRDGGEQIWSSLRSEDAFAGGDTASIRFWPPFDALTVEVALRPAMRARLVPGAGSRGFGTTLVLFLFNGVLLVGALVQMNRERQLMRVREGFVSAVSHELRTPLQQMLLYADLLQLGGLPSEKERARASEVLARETRRLIHLVDNVLEFRPSGPAVAPALVDTPWLLDDLVTTVVEEFAPLAESRRAEARVHADSGVRVRWHPDAARRVLLNLLDNAVKYGPMGGRVEVRTWTEGRRAVLAVDDQGPGIPAAERERVFRAYVRGEGHLEGGTGGTGIGLAIVRDLVERAGGVVRVEDAPGGGARLRVEIPAADVPPGGGP